MKRVRPIDRMCVINSALGKEKYDTVVQNCKIVNVLTGEIYPGEIGIKGAHISYVKADPEGLNRDSLPMLGDNYYDACGQYAIPGLIDSHIHIESSMLTPRNFTEASVINGTTTVVTDPHEITNVYGIDGAVYMHESSEEIPMRHFILAPSCVPATELFESNGGKLLSKDIKSLLKYERIIGIGEMMDYPGVLNGSKRVHDILSLGDEEEVIIQGHSPTLHSRELAAYIAGGAVSDHESTTAQEAMDKLRNGMYVDIREGSIARDLEAIVHRIKDLKFSDFLTLCSDDKEIGELLKLGHINHAVQCAVEAGMDPITAIKCVTINAAREIGYRDLGAIAPGFIADIVITPSLREISPTAVFFQGIQVVQNKKLLKEIPKKYFEIENKNSINIGEISIENLRVKCENISGSVVVNCISFETKESFLTVLQEEIVPVKEGYLDISKRKDLKYIAVINRYGSGGITVGVIKNFGIEKGAIASTVAHDSHNLILVYDTPKEGLMAVEEIKRIHGGMTCVADGKVEASLQLEVGGLMSKKKPEDLFLDVENIKKAYEKIGLKGLKNPLLKIVFLSLPVIPEIRITDTGIVHVPTQRYLKLIKE